MDESKKPRKAPKAPRKALSGPAMTRGLMPVGSGEIEPTGPLKELREAFSADRRGKPIKKAIGGVERWKHDVELLQLEWAIKYPSASIHSYLTEIKGYNHSQYDTIVKTAPVSEWPVVKAKVMDKLTESVVKRHIDLIAEVQDQHVRASKLSLAKAVEMLTRGIPVVFKGEPKLDADGKQMYYPLRAKDLLECTTAIEKAQTIYRRAMGLPNDEGGLQQILEKVEHLQVNVTNNNLNVTAGPATAEAALTQKLSQELSYDDIMLFIEAKRAEKKAKEAVEVPVSPGDKA